MQAPDSALHPAVSQGQQQTAERTKQFLPGRSFGSATMEVAARETPGRVHQGAGQLPARPEVRHAEGEGRHQEGKESRIASW